MDIPNMLKKREGKIKRYLKEKAKPRTNQDIRRCLLSILPMILFKETLLFG